jgi:uncharacterized protein (DUF1810 family)
MTNAHNLQRFLDAQESTYETALSEVENGRKQSHWMWYVFPQIQGLGFSETSKHFAIKDGAEAEAFLKHPVLGSRLVRICNALLKLPGNNATSIFGSLDDMKLQSSMTLFSSLPDADPVFQKVLEKFFKAAKDQKTLRIIGKQ